jgi:hypothetical protein
MSELITEQDAAAEKARNHPISDIALPPTQHWGFQYFVSVQDALDYLNTPPVQSAGEVSATVRNDGTVGMFYIYPPNAPLQPPQQWFFKNFSNPAAAVHYLNLPAAQSEGEVSATYRNDNTVGVFYIGPA